MNIGSCDVRRESGEPLSRAHFAKLQQKQGVFRIPAQSRKYIEAVKEVFPEGSIRNCCCQVTVGGGDDSNVDSDRLCSPDSLKLSLLQDSQERDLGVEREFTYLIQKDRTAISLLKPA